MLTFLRSFPGMYAKPAAGFGLVELLVSISIMILVTTVVLANHSTFTSSSLLRTQAYDVALRVREVQMAAVSSQSGTGNNFRAVNGIQFSVGALSATAPVDKGRYRAFTTTADIANSSWTSSIAQLGAVGVLDSRFEFGPITTVASDGTVMNHTVGLYITFVRPNFDARYFRGGNGVELSANTVAARIGIRPRGSNADPAPRYVVISRNGQVTVE